MQDTQLLLWDLSMDEVVMPLRRLAPSGGSPTIGSGKSGQSAHWENARHLDGGVLQPPPVRREVPKLAPVVSHRVHAEPLSGIVFTKTSILTVCHEGLIKVWTRPHNLVESLDNATDNSKDSNSTSTMTTTSNSNLGSTNSKH